MPPKGPRLPSRSFWETAGGPARKPGQAPSPVGSSLAAAPLQSADATFFETLLPYRNYAFLSRVEPLQHHYQVSYSVVEGVSSKRERRRTCVMSGESRASLRIAPVFCRGPCCDASIPEGVYSLSSTTSTGSAAESGVDRDVLAHVTSVLEEVEGPVAMVECRYVGWYRMVCVTEFIVRSVLCGPSSLSESMRSELGTPMSDLDRLDLETMLALLGPQPPAVSRGDESPIDPGTRTTLVATAKLFVDETGGLMNPNFWTQGVHVSVCRLDQLHPRRSSHWLDSSFSTTGCLVLSHPVVACGATESTLHREVLANLKDLASTAVTVSASVLDRSYSDAFNRVSFKLTPDTLVEDTYREFRCVQLELRKRPASTLPEDIVAAETGEPVSVTRLLVDVHEAYADPPSTCHRAVALHDGTPTGVSVRLDVCLRPRVASSTTKLIITGHGGGMEVVPLHVTMAVKPCPATGCIVTDDAPLFSGTVDAPRLPVRLGVTAMIDGVPTAVWATLRSLHVFGGME